MNITLNPSGFTNFSVCSKKPVAEIPFNYAWEADKGCSHNQKYGCVASTVLK